MEAGHRPSRRRRVRKTIADLLPLRGASSTPTAPPPRHKIDGAWHDVTYARGRRDRLARSAAASSTSGIQPGDRVCLLAKTRPEWTYCDFAISSAGAVVVPDLPDELAGGVRVGRGQLRGRRRHLRGRRRRSRRSSAVRDRLPDLRTIVVIDPAGDTADAIPLDELRARGRDRDAAELEARAAAVTPDDTFTFIYTSGTTGPPKGCVLTHGNYRRRSTCARRSASCAADEEIYLFLPLAHAFALLIQLLRSTSATTIAYFGGDPDQIVPELQEMKPTYLPSVPRIFEKVYTLVMASQPEEVQAQMKAAAGSA